jgi:fructokinase
MLFTKPAVICFGESLWDVLPTGPLPGGAPMNVAYHLKKLGENPLLVTRVGLDAYGKDLIDLAASKGLRTDFFQIDPEHPTGLVYATSGAHQEMSYNIVYPSSWDFISWEENYSSLLGQADYLVFGSLTSRSEASRQTLYRFLEGGATKAMDINLRPPFYNRPHIEYLLQKANILKMNIHELELITGWFSRVRQHEDRVSLLQDRFNINTIIVTMGEEGAMLNHLGAYYYHPGITVQVADTIGSGDAFLAGFLHQLIQDADMQEGLHFSSALGALIATYPGACPEYTHADIELLLSCPAKKIENHI